jgi:hypothetical protein
LASSRLTDDGRVIITTPGPRYAVGDVLYVDGSAAVYGIAPSDWVLWLVAGYKANGGRAFGAGIDVRPAREAWRSDRGDVAFRSGCWTVCAVKPCRHAG